MSDPNDLTIEPNDDDIADEYWGDLSDESTDDLDDFEIPEDLESSSTVNMTIQPKLIGLCGAKGVGKSTYAIDDRGTKRTRLLVRNAAQEDAHVRVP